MVKDANKIFKYLSTLSKDKLVDVKIKKLRTVTEYTLYGVECITEWGEITFSGWIAVKLESCDKDIPELQFNNLCNNEGIQFSRN